MVSFGARSANAPPKYGRDHPRQDGPVRILRLPLLWNQQWVLIYILLRWAKGYADNEGTEKIINRYLPRCFLTTIDEFG